MSWLPHTPHTWHLALSVSLMHGGDPGSLGPPARQTGEELEMGEGAWWLHATYINCPGRSYTNTVVSGSTRVAMKNFLKIKIYVDFYLCMTFEKPKRGFQFGAVKVGHLQLNWDWLRMCSLVPRAGDTVAGRRRGKSCGHKCFLNTTFRPSRVLRDICL